MQTFTVAVARKTPAHPLYGVGTPFGFVVESETAPDGIEGKTLELRRGESYKFLIGTRGHPFFLTGNALGGPEAVSQAFSTPTDVGEVTFDVTDGLPNNFYYQCAIHEGMGGKVEVRPSREHSISVAEVVAGLDSPVALTFAPREPQLYYVADQSGYVYKVDGVSSSAPVFLDVSENLPKLDPGYEERGLLGLCFHPDFTSQEGKFYIFYSTSTNKYPQKGEARATYYNCLSEFEVRGGKILYEEEVVLMKIPKTLNYHNGGKIAFGPDGYLYIAVGDGGPQGDPEMKAQNLSSVYGKILRIDVSETGPLSFRVPPDNPFIGRGLPAIYAYGFRNPWGLSFWGSQLIVTDAGSDASVGRERIYSVAKGGNHGWPIKEGSVVRMRGPLAAQAKPAVAPIFEYVTGDADFSAAPDLSVIIGGCVLFDDYIFGDISRKIHRFNLRERRYIESVTLPSGTYLKSFGQDGAGNIYALTSRSLGVDEDSTGKASRITVT